jgi:competence protein ComEA
VPAIALAPPPALTRATADSPVYVNQAGPEELRRLPGVGAKRAEAIVALRQKLGRFQRVEELLRVKGIGRATVRKWRPLVRLDSPPPSDGG